MNTRTLVIIAAIILSFGAAFAWMVQDPEPVHLPPLPAVAQTPEAPPRPSPRQQREAASPVKSEVPTAAAALPATQDTVAESDDATPATLPVAFNVFNRRNRHKIEGFVTNTSRQRLYVSMEVIAADGQPGSQVVMSLEPHEKKTFGTDSGLDLHPRDRLVLHSQPYPDVTAEVP